MNGFDMTGKIKSITFLSYQESANQIILAKSRGKL